MGKLTMNAQQDKSPMMDTREMNPAIKLVKGNRKKWAMKTKSWQKETEN